MKASIGHLGSQAPNLRCKGDVFESMSTFHYFAQHNVKAEYSNQEVLFFSDVLPIPSQRLTSWISCQDPSRIPQDSCKEYPGILPGSCKIMEDYPGNPRGKNAKKQNFPPTLVQTTVLRSNHRRQNTLPVIDVVWARISRTLALRDPCFRMRINLVAVLIHSRVFPICVPRRSRSGTGVVLN